MLSPTEGSERTVISGFSAKRVAATPAAGAGARPHASTASATAEKALRVAVILSSLSFRQHKSIESTRHEPER